MPKSKFSNKTLFQWIPEALATHTESQECLVWEFGTNAKGYGIVGNNRRSELVHRIAYEIATGKHPNGCVVQTCENRRCFAPAHLKEQQFSRQPKSKPRPYLLYEQLLKTIATHNSDECLIWENAVAGPMGYGIVTMPGKKREYVHRIAFLVTHGHLPAPETLHSCDNPVCYNPRHLSEGTKADNTADRMRKNRSGSGCLKGEAHGRAKLTQEQVTAIKEAYAKGDVTLATLGSRFGVSAPQIHRIVHLGSWNHQ